MKSSLRRIAEALEKQCDQNAQVIYFWKENLEVSKHSIALSQRHLEIAEERHSLEMLPVRLKNASSQLDEITKIMTGFGQESEEPNAPKT